MLRLLYFEMTEGDFSRVHLALELLGVAGERDAEDTRTLQSVGHLLQLACRANEPSAIRQLSHLVSEKDLLLVDDNCCTVFHLCSLHPDGDKAIEALLCSPLLAVSLSSPLPPLLAQLLQARTSGDAYTALHLAVVGAARDQSEAKSAALRALLPLVSACRKDEKGEGSCESLIDSLSGSALSPLMIAANNGQVGMVKLLLAAKACLGLTNSKGMTALHMATRNGEARLVQLLLDEAGGGNTVRIAAAHETGAAAVRALLYGRDSVGHTPLHLALFGGWPEVTQVLLDQDTILRTSSSSSSSSSESSSPSPDTAAPLILALSHAGKNALHLCCGKADDTRIDLLRLLTSYDSGRWLRFLLTAYGPFGATPLHLAAQSANDAAVRIIKECLDLHHESIDMSNPPKSNGEMRDNSDLSTAVTLLQDDDGMSPIHATVRAMAVCLTGLETQRKTQWQQGPSSCATDADGARDGLSPATKLRKLLSTLEALLDLDRSERQRTKEDTEGDQSPAASASDDGGYTPLHLLCYQLAVLDSVHISKSESTHPEEEGDGNDEALRVMTDAVISCCRILIREGADPTALDESEWSVLHVLNSLQTPDPTTHPTTHPTTDHPTNDPTTTTPTESTDTHTTTSSTDGTFRKGSAALADVLMREVQSQMRSMIQDQGNAARAESWTAFLSALDLSKPRNMGKVKRGGGPWRRLKPEQRAAVFQGDFSIEGAASCLLRLVDKLQAEESRKPRVVVMAGAGMSVNSGIPDFRSKKGIYSNSKHRSLFTSAAVVEQPQEFYAFARKTFGGVIDGSVTPTATHRFLALLHEKGWLARLYTQNIDMLEQRAGIPPQVLVEAHGSLANCCCTNHKCVNFGTAGTTRLATESDCWWPVIMKGQVPVCPSCASTLRPDVVFFGEGLPHRFSQLHQADLASADALIVIGTSLRVYPFAGLTNKVPLLCPRLLINRDAVGPFQHLVSARGEQHYRDVAMLGDCDDLCRQLAQGMGWDLE